MKIIIALTLAAALTACSLPTTQVNSGTTRPTLAIQGAPANAVLFLDGLMVGDAARYDGKLQKLYIEDGMHQVELRRGADVLLAQRIFASNGETSTVVYQSEAIK